MEIVSNKPPPPVMLDTIDDGSRLTTTQVGPGLGPRISLEDILTENIHKHRNSILDTLDPSTESFFKLLYKYKMDEKFTDQDLRRRKQAKKFLKKVQKRKLYFELLQSLEEDKEHMGHEYLACLLRGEEYGGQEEIKQSKILSERIVEKTTALDVKVLLPSLRQNRLITTNEIEKLKQGTKQAQAQLLVTILRTRGPTAHYILVHQCLAKLPFFEDLYTYLLAGSYPETIPLCPSRLKPPEAITTNSYYKSMKQLRKYQQMGGDKASNFCSEILDSESTLEEKIAFLLESCVSYFISNELEQIEDIIKQAEDMCKKSGNIDCLRARVGWVKAWLYKRRGDYDKALECIYTSLGLIYHYVSNTEEAILLNYCYGCILLITASNKEMAIKAFQSALDSNQEHYGFIIEYHGSIRLAQLYLGVSPENPTTKEKNVTKDDIQKAEELLKRIERKTIKERTQCMLQYTWSDLYRLDGQVGKARECAKKSLELAKNQQFSDLIECATMRHTLLTDII